jgi:ubiquinone/menaquinone biosynthesis C-methylase UbiE
MKTIESMKYEQPEIPDTLESMYFRYSDDLDFTIDDLKGKRVADLGCGSDALFVSYAVDQGIDIYGVDLKFDPKVTRDENLKKHLIVSDMKRLLLHDLDLILCRASFGIHLKIDKIQTLKSMMSALKPGGEIRIYPYPKPLTETLGGIKETRREMDEALKSLDPAVATIEVRPVKTVEASNTNEAGVVKCITLAIYSKLLMTVFEIPLI